MLFDIGWRGFWFCFGATLMLVCCAWKMSGSPAVLEKKQNDTIIQACEQELPRNKHCVLMAVPQDKLEIVK